MYFKNFKFILVGTLIGILLLLIYFLFYNPKLNSTTNIDSSQILPLEEEIDSLLIHQQYDTYVINLEKLVKISVHKEDTLQLLKTGVKLVFAYENFLTNQDSVSSKLNFFLPYSKAYTDQSFFYNYQFIKANHLIKIGKSEKASQILYNIQPIIEQNKYDYLPHFYDVFARFHYSTGNYDLAFDYLKKELNVFEKEGKRVNVASVYNNLGVLFKNTNQLDSAMYYHHKSLMLNKLLKDTLSISMSYNNLGGVYEKMNKKTKALEYFEKAYTINPLNATSSTINNYSEKLIQNKQYQKAEKLLVNITINDQDVQNKIESFNQLIKLYEIKGKYQNALAISQTVNKLEKLRLDGAKVKEIEKLNIQFETEKKQQLINELKEKQTLQDTISQQQYRIIIILVILFIILTLLGVAFISNIKQKNKSRQLKLEQQVLRSQMNPHFIFNTLTGIQNIVLEKNPLQASIFISRFAKLIRQNFDFIQKEWVSLEDEMDALHNYIATQKMRFEDSFDVKFYFELTSPKNQIFILPMLLQPLVENAINHAFKEMDKGGLISIMIRQISAYELFISVSDNGSGFQPKKYKTMHALDVLKLRLKNIAENNAKSLEIKDNTPKGTKVSFVLNFKNHEK